MGAQRGPVALVGSGEFLDAMTPVDRALLAGRPPRAVVLPTAAAREGDQRVAYWLDLARRHYEAMGVEPVLLDVRTRDDADDVQHAARIAGAGLLYLSGGDPHHLARTLRGTAVLDALVRAWHGGAALAGCSAGAMALTAGAPEDLAPGGRGPRLPVGAASSDRARNGLGLVAGLAVIPHYDQMERWRPGAASWFEAWRPEGSTLVGIEERTALVGEGPSWQVRGEQGVWVFGRGEPRRVVAGGHVPLEAPAW